MVVPTKWRNGYLRQLLICRCHSSFQRLWPNKDKGAHWSSMLLQCDVKHFMRSKYFHDLPRTQEVVPRNKPSTTRHKPHLHGFHLSFLGLKTFNKNQQKPLHPVVFPPGTSKDQVPVRRPFHLAGTYYLGAQRKSYDSNALMMLISLEGWRLQRRDDMKLSTTYVMCVFSKCSWILNLCPHLRFFRTCQLRGDWFCSICTNAQTILILP